MTAWSKRVNMQPNHNSNDEDKSTPSAPVVLESLLKRLIDERQAGNELALPTAYEYNMVISAWAEVAHQRKQLNNNNNNAPQQKEQTKQQQYDATTTTSKQAAARALYILRLLQRAHDREKRPALLPNSFSFTKVLAALSHAKDHAKAKTTLRWMEALYDRNLNRNAKPNDSGYTYVLNSIADSGDATAGAEAEQVLHQMNGTATTLHYTVAIKAWMKQESRQGAEQAEQLFHNMPVQPDIFTYGSLINAWAVSGMREYGAERADAIMQLLRDDPHVKPNEYCFHVNMNAWARSGTTKAIDRTEALLEEMVVERNLTANWFTYNIYLHALSAHGSVPGMAQRAEGTLLMMLKRSKQQGDHHLRPTRFSYNSVIDAWSRSRDDVAPSHAFRVLQLLLLEDDRVKPDAFSFNQVLTTFSRSQLKGAALKAERILCDWHEAHANGYIAAKPQCIAYTNVISAWARSGEPGAAERAQQLLESMERRAAAGDVHLAPTTITYNAAIDAWARSGEGTVGARRAESLLQRMQRLYDAGADRVQPNSITWNGVLNAWAKSGARCCAYKAQKYLDKMWEVHRSGKNLRVRPDDKTYNTVIAAISKSQNAGKAQLALRVLRKMDKLHQTGVLLDSPDGITYATVLQSCAVSSNFDERARMKALDTAIFTLEEIIGRPDVTATHVTYEVFLKAVVNLMPEAYELKKEVVEPVFTSCKNDGYVTVAFLAYLQDAVPDELYKELMGDYYFDAASNAVNHKLELPAAWTKNVPNRGRAQRRATGVIASTLPRRRVGRTNKRRFSS